MNETSRPGYATGSPRSRPSIRNNPIDTLGRRSERRCKRVRIRRDEVLPTQPQTSVARQPKVDTQVTGET